MKMKKLTLIAAMTIFSVATLPAQQEQTGERDLSRQVEVSKEYAPTPENAAKLGIQPNMVDTALFRPEFSYSIRPTAWVAGFGVAAINPAQVDVTARNSAKPFYVKLGGGYPAQSIFDLYATSTERGRGHVGVYANHYGQYGKIENDICRQAEALMTTNSAGVFGRTRIGRMILGGEIGYDHDIWSRYGQFSVENIPLSSYGEGRSPMQHYSTPRAEVYFGDDFSDLKYLNFRVGAGSNIFSDRYDNAQKEFNAFAEAGKMFSIHKFALKIEYGGWRGSKHLDKEGNFIFAGGLRYEVATDRFKLSLGGKYAHDMGDYKINKGYFLPEAAFMLNLTAGYVVPFATLDSRIINNSFRSMSRLNPYISPEHIYIPESTREMKLRAGILGNIASYFSYRLYAGMERFYSVPVFANLYAEGNTSDFVVMKEERLNVLLVGAEFEGRIAGNLSMKAAASLRDYSAKRFKNAIGRPKFNASLEAKYSYRDRLYIRGGAEVIGERYFAYTTKTGGKTQLNSTDSTLPLTVDITLGADYRVSSSFTVFVDGRNLANRKLYHFSHYPDQGIAVNAGVKLTF